MTITQITGTLITCDWNPVGIPRCRNMVFATLDAMGKAFTEGWDLESDGWIRCPEHNYSGPNAPRLAENGDTDE